jgi:very-short-patch-repair endonuclease
VRREPGRRATCGTPTWQPTGARHNQWMRKATRLPRPLNAEPFSVEHALNVGLSPRRLRALDLSAPFHGVRAPTLTPTLAQRCLALQTWLPVEAFFSDATAALLMGVPIPLPLERDARLHVTVPPGRRAPEGKGVVGHSRRYGPTDVRVWHGVRVSAPERVWCEMGAVLALGDLVAVGDHLIHWRSPLTTVEKLARATVGWRRRRGARHLEKALVLLNDRAESPQESRLRVILRDVPGMSINHWVREQSARIDIAFPQAKLAVEYQGDHHRDSETFRADLMRIARLESAEWHVLQVSALDLDDPVSLLERVRQKLASRGSGR